MRTVVRGVVVGVLALALPAACRRGERQAPVTAEAPEWLVTIVHDQAQQAAPGSMAVGNILKAVAHEDGDRTEWDVLLEPGNCYWFSVAGDQGVEELYLQIVDPRGDRVARRKLEGTKVILAHCPDIMGIHRVEAKVDEGRGHYHLGVYAKKAPQPAATSPTLAEVEED